MKRLAIQLLVILTLLLPAPVIFATGDEATTSTTTTTTTTTTETTADNAPKKKKKIRVSRAAAGKDRVIPSASTTRLAAAPVDHPDDKPVKKGARVITIDEDDPDAEVTTGGAAGNDDAKDEALDQFGSAGQYIVSDEGATSTCRCCVARKSPATRSEDKSMTAKGLITTVMDAFKDAIEKTNWSEKLNTVRNIKHVRRAVGDSAEDHTVEVTTGCCIPFWKKVFARTGSAQKAVNKDGKIDIRQLAQDIGKAIAIALKQTLEHDKANGTVELIEAFVGSIIEEVKAHIENERAKAAIELVQILSPLIVDQVKAYLKDLIEKWEEGAGDGDVPAVVGDK